LNVVVRRSQASVKKYSNKIKKIRAGAANEGIWSNSYRMLARDCLTLPMDISGHRTGRNMTFIIDKPEPSG
jgi:hypothetical protein